MKEERTTSKKSIREQRRRRRRRKRRLIAFLVLLITLAIAALIIIKVYTVEKVEVEGNDLYSDDMIISTVLNDEYSWNSLYVYLKYRIKGTQSVPFIDTMEVTMNGPHTIHINVYEKGLLGYLYISAIDEYAYFDKDGFVVETTKEIIPNTPQIEGIECSEVILYQNLPIDETILRDILTLTQSLRRKNLIPDSIVYGEEASPVIVFGDVRVLLGSVDSLTQKLERVSKILPQVKEFGGTLHMENWSQENVNIIFDKNE